MGRWAHGKSWVIECFILRVYHSGGFHHLAISLCEIHKLLVNILVPNYFVLDRGILLVYSIWFCQIFVKILVHYGGVSFQLSVAYIQLPVILIG